MDGAKAMMTIIITAPPGVILSQSNRLQHPARKKKKKIYINGFHINNFSCNKNTVALSTVNFLRDKNQWETEKLVHVTLKTKQSIKMQTLQLECWPRGHNLNWFFKIKKRGRRNPLVCMCSHADTVSWRDY